MGGRAIELNPDDAEYMGINGKKRVRISSRRGNIEAEALITDRVPPGMILANFHFPDAAVNELTIAALDPVAKIPEYKICAIKVEPVKKEYAGVWYIWNCYAKRSKTWITANRCR
jgi:formate dehydrogenase major subunit/formate dehydrogenase alpha subunit